MAAEMVLLENIESSLQKDQHLLDATIRQELRSSLTNAKSAMAELERRNESAALEVMEATVTSDVRNAGAEFKEKKAMADLENDPNDNQLNNIGALLYKSDDLIDEILSYNNGRRLPRASHQGGYDWVGKIGHFLSSPSEIVQKVKTATQQMNELVKQLQNSYNDKKHSQKEFDFNQSVALAENQVIGRDHDRDNIIEKLLQPKITSKTNVSVIPIVGSPGVGKSTLAKYVYDDLRVHYHFDLKIWVRVSQIIDEKEVVREIVESWTNKKSNRERFSKRDSNSQSSFCRDVLGCRKFCRSAIPPSALTNDIDICKLRLAKEMNEIDISESQFQKKMKEIDIFESQLRKEIKGKLFLLVVDDALIKGWDYLKHLLAKGARGSYILVTTRSLEVANLSKTENVEPYKLDGLEEKYSWSLFKTFAFGKDDQGESDMLEEIPNDFLSLFDMFAIEQEDQREPEQQKDIIGKSIANKCKGVPLTIKVAASLLHGKDIDQWSSFNKRLIGEAHKDIMNQVLHFSYTDLPTRLKVCFTYCSLFPENYIFNKQDLLSLWTSQGFIDQKQDQSSEEDADKYFIALFQRCFFEDATTDDLGKILTCKMHPIMRNLAYQHAAGAINMYVADSSIQQVPDTTCKHVAFTCVGDSSIKLAESSLHTRTLRTLLYVKEEDCDVRMGKMGNMFISKYKFLRALDLHDLRIEHLPDSIGKLRHLRYLDLSQNDLKTLPKSVTDLYNLQSLKLNSCMRLKILPDNFGQLINLKRFEVDKCDKLTSMPLGLERLTQLETLSRFIVSKDYSTELRTLENLKKLRGQLAIELSGDWATTISKVSRVGLQLSSKLEELKISWARTVQQKSSYQELLEWLRPHSDLKILCIEGYKGDYFPSWIKSNLLDSLPNLVVVSIEGCGKCHYLPPFSELKNLKRLTLRHMANVQIGEPDSQDRGSEESTSQSSSFFPSLEELTLQNFYKLERWQKELVVTPGQEQNIQNFSRLTKLKIWNCPKLRSMPLFVNVLELDLRNVNQKLLKDCAKKIPIATRQNGNNDFRIKNLQIKGCCNLESFRTVREGLGDLPSLKQLVIDGCDELFSLALELKHLTSLEKLEISNCKKLDLSDEGINTTSNTNNSNVSFTTSKLVHQKIEIPRNPWTSLQFLRHLTLREIPKMETLPEGLQHVQSLKTLWISACPSLRALPEWISSLIALQHLRIDSCRGVESLPDGISKVKTLVKVEITECPELMKRCKVHTGEDWHKIKHAWVVLHKSWRYGLLSEQGASQKRSNDWKTADVKYFIVSLQKKSTDF